MVKITREEVLKLAKLAKLELTNEEADSFTSDLEAILNYVEQLGTADTKGLEPTNQVTGLTNVMRRDEVINYGPTQKDLLKNVPKLKDGQLKVKRVL